MMDVTTIGTVQVQHVQHHHHQATASRNVAAITRRRWWKQKKILPLLLVHVVATALLFLLLLSSSSFSCCFLVNAFATTTTTTTMPSPSASFRLAVSSSKSNGGVWWWWLLQQRRRLGRPIGVRRPQELQSSCNNDYNNYNNDNDDDFDNGDDNDNGSIRWRVSPPPPYRGRDNSPMTTPPPPVQQQQQSPQSTPSMTASKSVIRRASAALTGDAVTKNGGGTLLQSSNNNNNLLNNISPLPPPRQLRVERYARLPVWPVWSGVLLFLCGLLLGKDTASRLENIVGGRVCPMILQQQEQQEVGTTTSTTTTKTTSPFLLLVHHHHRFPWWDGIGRLLTKQFLSAEGFPAHPHRGFTTLTYVLHGGLIHRDSMGVKQEYYGESSNNNKTNNSTVFTPVQWLFTGAGLLHEELFATTTKEGGERHELYQLWINVPAAQKLTPPHVQLLSTVKTSRSSSTAAATAAAAPVQVDMPVVVTSTTLTTTRKDDNNNPLQSITTKSTVRVLAGKYHLDDHNNNNNQDFTSAAPTMSDMNILHVTVKTYRNRKSERERRTMNNNNMSNDDVDTLQQLQTQQQQEDDHTAGWTYTIPPTFDTLLLYVRQGSCELTTTTTSQDRRTGRIESRSIQKHAPIHSTVFVEPSIEFQGGSNCRVLSESIRLTPSKVGETVDVLVLAGQPLYETYESNTDMQPSTTTKTTTTRTTTTTLEPIAMQGSMVMNYPHELQAAYADYQNGNMGRPWDHELSDDEWQTHVDRYPNRYVYDEHKKKKKKKSSAYDV